MAGTNLTPGQQVNYHHSRARRVVENAFGILARVISRAMGCSVETAEPLQKHALFCITSFVEGDSNLLDPRRLSADSATELGSDMCSLMMYFQSDTGKVDFQDTVLQRGTLHSGSILFGTHCCVILLFNIYVDKIVPIIVSGDIKKHGLTWFY